MASFTETLSLIIDAKTGGAVRDVQAFSSTVKNSGDDMVTTATKGGFLDKQLKNLGVTGVTSGNLIAAGAVLGGGALLKFGDAAIQTRLRYAGWARDFQRATGTNADLASRMVAVFDDLEISQEAAARGFFKLAREVGTNDTALEKFGVTVARSKDGNLDLRETMLRIADAYTHTSDQGQRAALIQEAFGRGGKELIPILEKGRKGIEELFSTVPKGQIFDQKQIDQARAYELAMDDLHDAVDELKMSFADDLIPSVAAAAQSLAFLIRFTSEARDTLQDLSGVGGNVGKALGSGLLKGLPVVGPVVGLTEAIGGLGKAFGIGGSDSDKLSDALKRQQDAEKEVTRLHNEGKDGSKEFAAAQRELANAKEAVTSQSKQLADALNVENQSQREAMNLAQQRLGGVTAVVAADVALQDAIGKREAAQAKVNQLEAEGKQGTFEYAAAQQDLAQAHIGVVQSFNNVQAAVIKLKDDVRNNKLSVEDYNAAITKLKEDNPAIASSIDFVSEAYDRQHKKIDDVPTSHHTEMTAADGVSGVADAAKSAISTVPMFHHTNFTASDFVSSVVANINTNINNTRAALAGFLSRQHGGPIPGGTYDAVPVMAHGGEYVLSSDVVQRIKAGRPSRGAAVSGGAMPTINGGGGVYAPVNVNVRGWVGNDQDIAGRLGSVFNRRGGPQLARRSIARSNR